MKILAGRSFRDLGKTGLALVGAAVAGLVVIVICLLLPHFAGAKDAPRPVPVATFLDSLGVNTHINFTGPDFVGYADTTIVSNSLRYIGFRHVRDSGRDYTPEQISRLTTVARDAGVRLTLTPGSGGPVNLDGFLQAMRDIEARQPGALEGIEGLNEVNNVFMHQHWNVEYKGKAASMCRRDFAPVKALQADLYKSVKADPKLKHLPVYAYTMVFIKKGLGDAICKADYQADLKAVGAETNADFANIHEYSFQGAPPREVLAGALARKSHVAGKPVVITETGFATDQNPAIPLWLSVSETVQAKYLLSSVFDAYTLGARRTYIYQLMDHALDKPATDIEKHFGLFYADGRPKPAAVALRNLTRILADPGQGAPAHSIPVSYSLKGAGYVPGMQLLLQKSDGTYLLALWAEPRIWNANTRSDIKVPAKTVEVTFDRDISNIAVYDPMKGVSPVSARASARMLKVPVSDHPVLVSFK
ncbi:hypothetical protein [Asticcacaulis sp. AND118]|uniref:hypothetical protein n=1 Tax=Asticcacaulis sp. AND118 TaxID=2840468 RepID=UPI001CFFE0B9|nr:hypothetical protein [Asticcacaulis sp. AND118]UDF05037.1 hypothetical protein LH365_16725 [Asticcacaulis sp. AND118]